MPVQLEGGQAVPDESITEATINLVVQELARKPAR